MSDQGGLKMRYVYWLAGKLPSCEAVSRMISESHERPLTRTERIQKWLHFTICEWCKRYEQQVSLIREAAHRAASSEAPAGTGLSDDARERMRRAIADRD